MSWRRYFPGGEEDAFLRGHDAEIVQFPSGLTLVEPDQIFIEDLVLEASIGIYKEELTKTQPVKFNIVLDIDPIEPEQVPDEDNIVCYDKLIQGIKAIVDAGHIGLVEDLAERVARLCLGTKRVRKVSIRMAKPEAISAASAVGIRIVRQRQS